MRRWRLTDHDCTGLLAIQACAAHRRQRDGRIQYTDEAALALARQQAGFGDSEALQAVAAHDRDAPLIARYRQGDVSVVRERVC